MTGLDQSSSGQVLRTAAVKGVAWSAGREWSVRTLSFVVFLILVRLLEPEAFGLVALAATVIEVLRIFASQGFGTAIIQRYQLEPEHLDSAFWTNVAAGFALLACGIGVAIPAANLYGEPDLAPVVGWLALSFPLHGLNVVQDALLRRRMEFRILAMRSIVAAVVGGLVGIGMALSGFGVWSLVGQQLSTTVTTTAVLWMATDWRPALRFSWPHAKELLSFGLNVMGVNLLNVVNWHADDFLIGLFLGPVQLGYYSVAYRIPRMLTRSLTNSVSSVALPAFSKLQGSKERTQRAFLTGTRINAVVAFPVFVGTALIAPEFVTGVLGDQWSPSIPVLRVLAFIGLWHSVAYFHPPVMVAMGKPQWDLGLTFLSAVTNVMAFAIAVRWGIVAVAAAFVIRAYLLAPLPLMAVRSLTGLRISEYLRQFLAPATGCLLMAAAVLGTKAALSAWAGPRLGLLLSVLGGAIVYSTALALLARPTMSELFGLARLALSSQGKADTVPTTAEVGVE